MVCRQHSPVSAQFVTGLGPSTHAISGDCIGEYDELELCPPYTMCPLAPA
jgi:hypothetical protein